jgi:membrane peptidoglycan carboxypeptidase
MAVLISAMITPAVTMTAAAADSAINVFNQLPDDIALGTQAQQNGIYANRDGQPVQIATVFDQNRQVVGWDQVSPLLREAAVAGEDRRFWDHGGVDMTSIFRAATSNFTTGKTTSGASTIDMQLVRNILIQEALQIDDPAARKRAYRDAITDTLDRKLKEAKLAIALDKRYSKNEILLAYLNITGFGGQTYGVQAAARQYFSVEAKDVTLAQAASLIAIVQQPTMQNLKDPKYYPANKIRRDQILGDMLEEDYIDRQQYDDAIATKIEDMVKLTPPSNGCLYAADAKFACDYVRRLVPTLDSLGASPAERQRNWARGGYKLYTSIDLNQQDVAQANLDKSAPATETRFKLGAAATAVQPGTGRILLMAQNKIFDDSGTGDPATTTAVNFNTDKNYGGSSGFQTGSTYKIFALTNWLQTGHSLYDIVDGTPRPFPMKSFKASCAGFVGEPYAPGNDAAWERGKMTVLDATRNSVNVAFVTMAQKLDLCAIRDAATAMGVHRADGAPLDVYPSSVLGTNEISPLSMAGAIATIGANGLYCAPTIVDKLVGPDGSELPGQPKQCTQGIDPNIAATVAFALKSVMTAGTGTAGNPQDGVPIVGKTGTAEESHQNWLVATTTKVSLAVWVGNITGGQSLRKISVAGTNGYNTKFNIFRGTMASLDSNPEYRGGEFPPPDQSLMRRPRPVTPPAPKPTTPPVAPVPPPVPVPPVPPPPPGFPGPGLPPGFGNGAKP